MAKNIDNIFEEAKDVLPAVLQEGRRNHIISVEEFKGNGISGGHNLDEFMNFISGKDNIKVVSKTEHPEFKGIYDIEYQFPKKDSQGNILTDEPWKTRYKTVYDPNVFSNDEIIELGLQAMQEGLKAERFSSRNRISQKVTGTASNGLEFEGYQVIETGEFRTIYPKAKTEME